MLRRMANKDLNRRKFKGGRMAVNGSLNRVSEELADDIFDMGENVREGCVKMTLDLDLGDAG